jgi:hypothetical protein
VYLALVVPGAPAPLEMLEWDLAEKFGWTLEYIENLSLARLYEYLQIQDGRAHARNSQVKGKL